MLVYTNLLIQEQNSKIAPLKICLFLILSFGKKNPCFMESPVNKKERIITNMIILFKLCLQFQILNLAYFHNISCTKDFITFACFHNLLLLTARILYKLHILFFLRIGNTFSTAATVGVMNTGRINTISPSLHV